MSRRIVFQIVVLLTAGMGMLVGPSRAQQSNSGPIDLFIPFEADLSGVEGGSASVGDVNEDGNIDLVITGTDASGTPIAALYLGTGMGGFIRVDAGLRGVRNGTSSLGDVDNDLVG